MRKLYTQLKARFAQRDRGATAAEYALLVAGITIVVLAAVGIFSGALGAAFEDACDNVSTTADCTLD